MGPSLQGPILSFKVPFFKIDLPYLKNSKAGNSFWPLSTFPLYMLSFYMQHEGRGKAAEVDENVAKWTKICRSTVSFGITFGSLYVCQVWVGRIVEIWYFLKVLQKFILPSIHTQPCLKTVSKMI